VITPRAVPIPEVARDPVLQTWSREDPESVGEKTEERGEETNSEDSDVSRLASDLRDPVRSSLTHEDVPSQILNVNLPSDLHDLLDSIVDTSSRLDGFLSGLVHPSHRLSEVDGSRSSSVEVGSLLQEVGEERICRGEDGWARGGGDGGCEVVSEDESSEGSDGRSSPDLHALDGIEGILESVHSLPLDDVAGGSEKREQQNQDVSGKKKEEGREGRKES